MTGKHLSDFHYIQKLYLLFHLIILFFFLQTENTVISTIGLEKVNLTSVVIVQNKIVPTIIVIKKNKEPTIVNTIIFVTIPTVGKTIPKIEPNSITYNPIHLQQQCALQIKVFELG